MSDALNWNQEQSEVIVFKISCKMYVSRCMFHHKKNYFLIMRIRYIKASKQHADYKEICS